MFPGGVTVARHRCAAPGRFFIELSAAEQTLQRLNTYATVAVPEFGRRGRCERELGGRWLVGSGSTC
jgi:hypothetical protein